MHRPKSSWAEIIGAIGAVAAAEAANRTAREVRDLHDSQQESVALLKNQLQLERQRLENEERLRESVRKLRQSLFDFSEALPNLRAEIDGLLPDYYCAAALFSEMELQRQVDALYANRELLESYEDKKLLKNCLETVTSVRALVEECAAADGVPSDELDGVLHSLRLEIRQWRSCLQATREQVDKLSRFVAEWDGAGPNEFLIACEHLRTGVAEAQPPLHLLGESLQKFEQTFDFVCSHSQICQIWSDACDASPKKATDIFSRAHELFATANQLFLKWMGQIADFKVLLESYSEARYEDFLGKLEKCSPELRQLPEVCRWADIAGVRLQMASTLIQTARAEIACRNWRSALAQLGEARNVPCSQRLRPELNNLVIAASAGLLPLRLIWVVVLGAILGVASYWFEFPRWFWWLLGVLAVFLVLWLSPRLAAARKAGAPWRTIWLATAMLIFLASASMVLLADLVPHIIGNNVTSGTSSLIDQQSSTPNSVQGERDARSRQTREVYAQQFQHACTVKGVVARVSVQGNGENQGRELNVDSEIFNDPATRDQFLNDVEWQTQLCGLGFRNLRLQNGGMKPRLDYSRSLGCTN